MPGLDLEDRVTETFRLTRVDKNIGGSTAQPKD